MSILDFKGRAQAEAWKNELRDLNDRTNQVLSDVSNCISEIQTESAGDPVEQLVTTAADLIDAAAEVIKGLRGLEDAIDSIIALLIQGIASATQAVVSKRSQATNL